MNRYFAYMICLLPVLLILSCRGRKNEKSTTVSSSDRDLYIRAFGVTFEFIRIEPGSFVMGSDAGEDYEGPPHRVNITREFRVGESEVTREQWQAVMGGQMPATDEVNLPVTGKSWFQVQDFIKKMNSLGKGVFRLPTEAEWEYAAGRSTLDSKKAQNDFWFSGNSEGTVHPVGEFPANENGLYDMSGNAREWCGDWFFSGYYGKSPENDPFNTRQFKYAKSVRGGSFSSTWKQCMPWARAWFNPSQGNGETGFRLVAE